MVLSEVLGIIGALFEIGGTYLLAKKNKYGFISNIIGNLIWISFTFLTNSAYGLTIVAFICILLNINGIIYWSKKGINMKVKPLGKRIIVKPEEVEEVSKGGIILSPGSQERPTRGIVQSIGKDVEDIAVGDVIFYGKYAGTQIDLEEDKLIILPEKDVLYIIEE